MAAPHPGKGQRIEYCAVDRLAADRAAPCARPKMAALGGYFHLGEHKAVDEFARPKGGEAGRDDPPCAAKYADIGRLTDGARAVGAQGIGKHCI